MREWGQFIVIQADSRTVVRSFNEFFILIQPDFSQNRSQSFTNRKQKEENATVGRFPDVFGRCRTWEENDPIALDYFKIFNQDRVCVNRQARTHLTSSHTPDKRCERVCVHLSTFGCFCRNYRTKSLSQSSLPRTSGHQIVCWTSN